MGTIAESGLFPPIIDSYLPAIDISTLLGDNGSLEIPFNISDYNNIGDIKSVHVTITRQSNYTSLFDSVNYIRGVYVANIDDLVDKEYNLVINNEVGIFNISNLAYNEYYKVQVRLSKDDSYEGELKQELSEYLTNESNLLKFSEWSTVCLIRFIAPSTIALDCNGTALDSQTEHSFSSSNLTLSGKYIKQDMNNVAYPKGIRDGDNDQEYLSFYKVTWYRNQSGTYEEIGNSGNLSIETNTPDSFIYNIPYFFAQDDADEDKFKIRLDYITNDKYEGYEEYVIIADYRQGDPWNTEGNHISELLGIDTVIGKVNITFEPRDPQVQVPQGSHLMIRRASDQDNFTKWDVIWTKTISEALTAALSYDDFTIESGILYKYEITYTEGANSYTIVEGPILSVFDNAFLTGQGTQLCVRFNTNISNYRHNFGDNIVTTLGSQYPYVSRNGTMNYRSFSLSGTIAYEMDVENQFATRSSIYGEWINVYGSYFVNRFMNQQNDRVTQRKLRELVMDYLYNDKPKLFRSTPEGNILVRITDVSLTPNQQLSRMIYDFSCTVTEIGEASVENFKLYQIQDYGD